MSFITFRRYYLDQCLTDNTSSMQGRVLDIGGKKDNKRGSFRPPLNQVQEWIYLNSDTTTNPDIIADAEKISVPDGSYDTILLTEVLEHVRNPEDVLRESKRILARNGNLILSMPFLVGIHGDPDDYQRWTRRKLEHELQKSGFKITTISKMGGIIAVIWDLLRAQSQSEVFLLRLAGKILLYTAPLFKVLDRLISENMNITTGYFIIAENDK